MQSSSVVHRLSNWVVSWYHKFIYTVLLLSWLLTLQITDSSSYWLSIFLTQHLTYSASYWVNKLLTSRLLSQQSSCSVAERFFSILFLVHSNCNLLKSVKKWRYGAPPTFISCFWSLMSRKIPMHNGITLELSRKMYFHERLRSSRSAYVTMHLLYYIDRKFDSRTFYP